MSFFSCHNAVSGYRGTFYTDHTPYIYKDNGQNNNVTKDGASNWVDRAYIASPRNSNPFPAGFHVFNCSTPTSARANAFAEAYNTKNYTSFGGTRIAEYAVFTGQLSDAERAEMTGYLRAKWFPLPLASVTVASGASLAVDEDVKLDAPISADGARNLDLGSQTLVFNHGLSGLGAWIHVDASQTNTMTIIEENGTNFVTRWSDVEGGAGHCDDENTTGLKGQRTNPERRKPFLSPDLTQNGLPIIDLGSAIHFSNTNGHGASFVINGLDRTYIAEYLAVISDTEDLKTSFAGKPGPSYISYRGGTSPWAGQNEGRRGELVSGKNPPLFRSSNNAPCVNGTNYVNGVLQPYSFNPPDGFNIINIRPASKLWCNLIGRNIRGVSGQTIDSYGGQRIAEYMLFTSVIDDAKRQRIYNALRNKWFGDVPATTNSYGALSLGAEASLTVKYEAVAVADTLSLAGALAAPAVSAANMAVAGADATVDGSLTLADGATLSFRRLPDGSWTSLSATSLTAEGAVAVSLSGAAVVGLGGTSVRLVATDSPPASLDGWTVDLDSVRATARLVLKDDGIWAEFFSTGTLMMVR